MPFKLFSSSKNAKKDKSAGTNAIDLAEQKSEEPPDCEVKAITKSKLNIFSSNCSKNNNHVHFKDTSKDRKLKNVLSWGQEKKTKSLTHLPSNAKEDAAHSAEHCSKNHRSAKPQGRTRRSASYGTFMDSLTRERRLMEIAQLDNYIEYLRHTEDEGNLTNRMCCAQVLKLGLIRIEMAHRNSLERLDRVSPVNGVSQRLQSNGKHPNNKHADASDAYSNHSDRKEYDSGSDQGAFSNDTDSDSRGSEHDSGSDHDKASSCRVQENRSKLTFGVKDKRTPVWPSDIEIF